MQILNKIELVNNRAELKADHGFFDESNIPTHAEISQGHIHQLQLEDDENNSTNHNTITNLTTPELKVENEMGCDNISVPQQLNAKQLITTQLLNITGFASIIDGAIDSAYTNQLKASNFTGSADSRMCTIDNLVLTNLLPITDNVNVTTKFLFIGKNILINFTKQSCENWLYNWVGASPSIRCITPFTPVSGAIVYSYTADNFLKLRTALPMGIYISYPEQ